MGPNSFLKSLIRIVDMFLDTAIDPRQTTIKQNAMIIS